MGYFEYLAKQAFATASTGERLFYRGTVASCPYVIPDAATEERLFKKQLWFFRILVGGMIVLQPFLFIAVPQLLTNPLWFVGYIVAAIAVERVVGFLIFRSDLARLERLPAPLPAHDFYVSFAARHSPLALKLGLAICLLFTVAGIGIVATGQPSAVVGLITVAFFGVCGWVWGYALRLKGEQLSLQETHDAA